VPFECKVKIGGRYVYFLLMISYREGESFQGHLNVMVCNRDSNKDGAHSGNSDNETKQSKSVPIPAISCCLSHLNPTSCDAFTVTKLQPDANCKAVHDQ